ncbi:effector-associated constant component EACC1 [Amycolatopsis vancoresmycina]|uniref:Uncharacterized protein n=1 Tax=Amycolatopsis vancoresmycina DSM 44592 TaxID=1292037 RepID=R1FWZ3_9PSEU|nr:hypothetical protein [Amycolatopsis vancoresmycina]EOD63867.1 hypothetical protein H480_34876 [Amycolatopsis vancoresmycina DSM 44592]
MELTIETTESELRSLRDWLAAEDELRSTRVNWKPAEQRPGEMGAVADVLVVALGAGGAGTVVANSIATWIKHRSRDLKLKITTKDRIVEIEAGNVQDPAEIVTAITRLLPPE